MDGVDFRLTGVEREEIRVSIQKLAKFSNGVFTPVENPGPFLETSAVAESGSTPNVYRGFGQDLILRFFKKDVDRAYVIRDGTPHKLYRLPADARFATEEEHNEARLALENSFVVPNTGSEYQLIRSGTTFYKSSFAFAKEKPEKEMSPKSKAKRYVAAVLGSLGLAGYFNAIPLPKLRAKDIRILSTVFLNYLESYSRAQVFYAAALPIAGLASYYYTQRPSKTNYLHHTLVVKNGVAQIKKTAAYYEDTENEMTVLYAAKCDESDSWLQIARKEDAFILLINKKGVIPFKVDLTNAAGTMLNEIAWSIDDVLLDGSRSNLFVLRTQYDARVKAASLQVIRFTRHPVFTLGYWAPNLFRTDSAKKSDSDTMQRPALGFKDKCSPLLYLDSTSISVFYLAVDKEVYLVRWKINLKTQTRTTTARKVDITATQVAQVVKSMVVLKLVSGKSVTLPL